MQEQLSTDNKVEILKTALEERYSSLHIIRSRVQEICLWSLGLLVGASAWFIQSNTHLSFFEKALYVLLAIVVYIVLRYVYFLDLEKGFKRQQRALVQVEKVLHFYSPGYYSDDGDALYPESWKKAGTTEGDGRFFKVNYYPLQLGLAIFIITILLKGCGH